MLTLCAQASNAFTTSQAFQKWSGDVTRGNSGKYFSIPKLQDRTGYRLIKTQLISSVPYFNLDGS